jgi:hypothetical protein
MLKFRFTFLVFDGQEFQKEALVEQTFTDAKELVTAMAQFAAMQSGVRLHSQVIPVYRGKSVDLPRLDSGYGLNTFFGIVNSTYGTTY